MFWTVLGSLWGCAAVLHMFLDIGSRELVAVEFGICTLCFVCAELLQAIRDSRK